MLAALVGMEAWLVPAAGTQTQCLAHTVRLRAGKVNCAALAVAGNATSAFAAAMLRTAIPGTAVPGGGESASAALAAALSAGGASCIAREWRSVARADPDRYHRQWQCLAQKLLQSCKCLHTRSIPESRRRQPDREYQSKGAAPRAHGAMKAGREGSSIKNAAAGHGECSGAVS